MRSESLCRALALCGLAVGLAAAAAPAQALLFDQNVTPGVIFGSGNANGSFTVDRQNGIELGLRGKVRFNASNLAENTFNSGGDGTYTFDKGQPPGGGFGFASGSSSTAKWNFEWSVNSNFDGNGNVLNAFSYLIELDFDPGIGTNFQSFDPIIAICADHSLGTNATTSANDTVVNCSSSTAAADYATAISANNVAQNSWNMEFFDNVTFPFDGNSDGQYEFRLSALDGNSTVAQTQISIIVGGGAGAVPEPFTASLLGIGLLGLVSARRRRPA